MSDQTQVSQPDYDHLLRSNLERVYNERDAEKRLTAIADLFVPVPILFEPDAIIEGQAALSEVAGKLLEQFGPTFAFVPDGVAVGHHGFACLRWRGGPKNGPTAVTGTDAAEIVDGKISKLWVLLNPPAGAS